MRNAKLLLLLTEMLKNKRSKLNWRRRQEVKGESVPATPKCDADARFRGSEKEKNKLTDGFSLAFLVFSYFFSKEKLRVSTKEKLDSKRRNQRELSDRMELFCF